jgi:hypothetical protein
MKAGARHHATAILGGARLPVEIRGGRCTNRMVSHMQTQGDSGHYVFWRTSIA